MLDDHPGNPRFPLGLAAGIVEPNRNEAAFLGKRRNAFERRSKSIGDADVEGAADRCSYSRYRGLVQQDLRRAAVDAEVEIESEKTTVRSLADISASNAAVASSP